MTRWSFHIFGGSSPLIYYDLFMQGIKSMLFLDFAYVTLSPSLTFSFLVAWRDRELLPGFPGKACRDKHKLILFSGECGTPRPRPLRPLSQARLAPNTLWAVLGVFHLLRLQLTRLQGARPKSLKALLKQQLLHQSRAPHPAADGWNRSFPF